MKAATFLSLALLLLAAPASATTCSQAVARCVSDGSNQPNIASKCQAAGDECKKSGTFLGPVSGKTWKGLKKQ
jgi:hypothetical protein